MLTVSGLTKSFSSPEGRNLVIKGIDFTVKEGDCYALLGPSGCGKTTTLRCVAGLEQADAGVITIGGQLVSDPAAGVFIPVHERPIGMVFQSYAIWPHLDVFENIAYPLRVHRPRLAKTEIEQRVMDALKLVNMTDFARRASTRLSGGQQQRVALARAIVRNPALLLLDEPLSNLDARLRDTMRKELGDLIARVGITALFVTHDQAEAFALADRIAVMNHGVIVQEGTPREIYRSPRDPFVAFFMGSASVLAGRATSGDEIVLAGGGHRLRSGTALCVGEQISVVLRPEQLKLVATVPQGIDNVLHGHVRRLTFQGGNVECEVDLGASLSLRVPMPADLDLNKGAPVAVVIHTLEGSVFRTGHADTDFREGGN
jgi:iron(III) transport system ATP-binding protein